jgi:hypothetical protein
MGIRSRTIALVATSSLMLWLAIASVAVFYTGQAANETDRRGSLGGARQRIGGSRIRAGETRCDLR